ncbi:CAP domain-containing protein [Syncephalis fuscata]|nr:CAP domain-containing protein [Syncephalis fuscata]
MKHIGTLQIFLSRRSYNLPGYFTILATIGLTSASSKPNVTKMLCLVNKFRHENGLAPLGLDTGLIAASQKHSQLMADTRTMEHQLSGEPDLFPRINSVTSQTKWTGVAENIAYGQKDEETVTDTWIKSPGHRANMLGTYTHFGGGMSVGDDNLKYWTQDFGNDGQHHDFPICPEEDASLTTTHNAVLDTYNHSDGKRQKEDDSPSYTLDGTCTVGQSRCDGNDRLVCRNKRSWTRYTCPQSHSCQVTGNEAQCYTANNYHQSNSSKSMPVQRATQPVKTRTVKHITPSTHGKYHDKSSKIKQDTDRNTSQEASCL